MLVCVAEPGYVQRSDTESQPIQVLYTGISHNPVDHTMLFNTMFFTFSTNLCVCVCVFQVRKEDPPKDTVDQEKLPEGKQVNLSVHP